MAAIALALGVAGYALSAHAWTGEGDTNYGQGPGASVPGGGNYGRGYNSPTQNQTGNPDLNPGRLRQQWFNSLPSKIQQLARNPEFMDQYGRLPGEPGYKGKRTLDEIAKSYGFTKNKRGQWQYKGKTLPNQPGSSGMNWGGNPGGGKSGRIDQSYREQGASANSWDKNH